MQRALQVLSHRRRAHTIISQKVFMKLFSKSRFLHKSVNSSFLLVIVKDREAMVEGEMQRALQVVGPLVSRYCGPSFVVTYWALCPLGVKEPRPGSPNRQCEIN